jgi:putative toxin-antitoxin system antitoxin component (TIGR02293 family)
MPKRKKRKTSLSSHEEILSVVDEAAIRYNTLRVILGGHASVLGPISNELDLIKLSRQGVKKSSLYSLAGYLGITMEKMSSLLHTSYRNIQRKDEDELLDSLKTEKVLELAAFIRRGIEVTGSEEAFKEWLHSPIPALGNREPVDFLDTTFGIQMVLRILGRLEHGVFS